MTAAAVRAAEAVCPAHAAVDPRAPWRMWACKACRPALWSALFPPQPSSRTRKVPCGFCLSRVTAPDGIMRDHADGGEACRGGGLPRRSANALVDAIARRVPPEFLPEHVGGFEAAAGELRLRRVDCAALAEKQLICISAELKRVRNGRSLRLYDMWRATGLGRDKIAGWEHGECVPQWQQLSLYARALGYQMVLLCPDAEPVPAGDPGKALIFLAKERVRLGIGILDLQLEYGFQEAQLLAWESGLREPSATFLGAYAVALGYTIGIRALEPQGGQQGGA